MRPEQLPIIESATNLSCLSLEMKKISRRQINAKSGDILYRSRFLWRFFKKQKFKSVKKRDEINKKLHCLFYIILRTYLPCIFQRNYHYYSEIVEAKSSKNLLYELTILSKGDSLNLCANSEFCHVKGSLR